MYKIIGVWLLACCYTAFADEPMSYVIVTAVSPKGKPIPQWIAFCSCEDCEHVPANSVLSEIKAGQYRLSHFDFLDNPEVNYCGRAIFLSKKPHFEFKPNKIYYIGSLSVSWTNVRGLTGKTVDLQVSSDISHIKAACTEYPELFAKFPLLVGRSTEEQHINCSRGDT